MKPACLCGLLPLILGAALFGQTTTGGPSITSVSNSASAAAAIESGSWVSIYGTGLSATTRSWQASDFIGSALPTTIDNVTVLIDGKKAAIAYVSPTQLNVLAPADTASGTVPVQVANAAGTAAGTASRALNWSGLRAWASAIALAARRQVSSRGIRWTRWWPGSGVTRRLAGGRWCGDSA